MIVEDNRWDEKAGLRTGCGVRSQVIDVLEAQIKRRPAMKKVSTVAARASKKISRQKLTVGLDLGDRNSWYCVLDESGQIKRRPAMKKVSTVAARASKKISRQKLTVGLDLGDRNSWYCVLDESGQIQLEQRVGTNAKLLRQVFGAMPRSRIRPARST